MADDGEVDAYPREQYLHVDDLEYCAGEKVGEPNHKSNIFTVKFIRVVCHELYRFNAILENIANIQMHGQSDDEL